jgi:UDP-N-acetylglucosamine 2-epimerase (non-hydrolysing)/GDP/UDP-N,N'-diacetylbacillosamine 2-epimerase (hydrolysing)
MQVSIIAFGPHLSPAFAHTIDEIEKDDFHVAERVECLLSSDTDIGMAKTIGIAAISLADILGKMRPDILLLIADRYEMLAPASVALALRIPIAHIEGGEVSEGAIDDAVRNALTKMSHIHLTTTERARLRVLALGEEAWRVHRVGAPSLDHLQRRTLLPRKDIESALGIDLTNSTVVVTFHPVTLNADTTSEADALFAALEQLPQQLVFCYPNADAGTYKIIRRINAFCRAHPRARLFTNLDQLKYWSLLSQVDLVIGNSSSGIMETPSLALPAVNIGTRQKGRERARNILDAEATVASILERASQALESGFRDSLTGLTNPYGDGRASERIARILSEAPLGEKLLIKREAPFDSGLWKHAGDGEL